MEKKKKKKKNLKKLVEHYKKFNIMYSDKFYKMLVNIYIISY